MFSNFVHIGAVIADTKVGRFVPQRNIQAIKADTKCSLHSRNYVKI